MKFIFSKKCLEYCQAGHPESPKRVKNAYEFLKKKGFSFLEPEVASEKDILRVHSKELFEKVKSGDFYDLDSPAYENIFYYASLSAGAAIMAMNFALKNKEHSFSLMRPPGHHASKDKLGGFCYFNNIAIAVAKALEEKNQYKVNKVVILDIDFHHGNGTQDIFLNNNGITFVSLHHYPDYPGTGEKSKKNCLNYPLSSVTNEKEYLEKLDEAIKKIKKFAPDLIAISAGFDTYEADPVGDLNLKIEIYEKIGKIIKNLGKPSFSVLEGGYSSALGECIWSYLKGIE